MSKEISSEKFKQKIHKHTKLISPLLHKQLTRKLLGFGEVSDYLGYNAMLDFFPKSTLKPNPECSNNYCKKHQAAFKSKPRKVVEQKKTEEKKIVHEENNWGITLESSSEVEQNDKTATKAEEPAGTYRLYEVDTKKEVLLNEQKWRRNN